MAPNRRGLRGQTPLLEDGGGGGGDGGDSDALQQPQTFQPNPTQPPTVAPNAVSPSNSVRQSEDPSQGTGLVSVLPRVYEQLPSDEETKAQIDMESLSDAYDLHLRWERNNWSKALQPPTL